MSDLFDRRTRRVSHDGGAGDGGALKRSLAIKLGVVGVGLVGGYSVMAMQRTCTAPPDRNSAEAQTYNAAQYQELENTYEQCRRRRTSNVASRSRSRSFFGSGGSNRTTISRGGFGRSGSFGG